MRVLGVVTAHGGSRGVPGKNIRPLAGRPLLWYTAEAARHSRRLTRTVLSTDAVDIAEVGRTVGLEVPFLRPPALAADDTPTLPVLQDVVRRLAACGEHYDAVMTLQPTSPLRTAADIDGAIDLLVTTQADSVVSFTEVNPQILSQLKRIVDDRRVCDLEETGPVPVRRRQELSPLFQRDGAIYLTRTDWILERERLVGEDCRAWIMPAERSCNIDTVFDFAQAEWLVQRARRGAEFGA